MVKVLTISDEIAPFLVRVMAGLGDRGELHAYIAGRMEQVTREYVLRIAPDRHDTAERLGATPTGHLGKAAESIESQYDRNAAIVAFPRSTGLHRAFQSVTITPGPGKKFLTIPVNAAAYGKRAGEFTNLIFLRVGPRGTAVLARRINNEPILETMYLLLPQVFQEQDRSLLPSDMQYLQSAELGARDWIEAQAAELDGREVLN